MRCLAIIPAFNEAGAVGDVIRAIQRERPDVDVAVVDDGSRDATASVAREAGAIVLQLPFNLGIGGAVQTGYKYAWDNGYDIAIQVDADGQHPPSEMSKVIDPVVKGEADMVKLYQDMYMQAIALLKNLGDGKQRTDTYRDGQTRIKVS